MLKKLILCLVLAMALVIGPIGGVVMAMEDGQKCMLTKGSKVLQMMPNTSMRSVVVPEDISVEIGPELTLEMAMNLNKQTDMDWSDGHTGMIEVDFGQGPIPIIVIMKTIDVKECK